MKQLKIKKTALLMLCSALACTSIASAVTYTWIDRCSGNLDYLFGYSWCDMDWNDGANWILIGFPSSGDHAVIKIDSNSGNNGPWQQINLNASRSILSLTVETPPCISCFIGKQIKLVFWEPFQLQALTVKFDATEGDVTVIAGNGAFITTLQNP